MTQIKDLVIIDTEHLISENKGPLVKIRAIGDGVILLGQVDPVTAYKLAVDLMTSASRAEYEHDLYTASIADGMSDEAIGYIIHLVRNGEAKRLK